MSPHLRERIAATLGWTPGDVDSFSLLTLRDLVRPVSPKLANEITLAMGSPSYIVAMPTFTHGWIDPPKVS